MHLFEIGVHVFQCIKLACGCLHHPCLTRRAHFLNACADYKENTVPLCVDYVIHRIGEFAMLMIGESVLSLLAVPVEDEARSYLVFGGGTLIASHLCFQHFSVYPTNPKDHVLRASKFNHAGVTYLFLMVRRICFLQLLHHNYLPFSSFAEICLYSQIYVYAAALIMIGVGCKSLLTAAHDDEVFEQANSVLAVSLLVAFLNLTLFSVLHHETYIKETIRTRGKILKWVHLRHCAFVFLSVLAFIPIALVGMRPSHTMVSIANCPKTEPAGFFL